MYPVSQNGATKVDPETKIPGFEATEAEQAAAAEKEQEQAEAQTAAALQAAQQVQSTGLPEYLTPESLVAYCDCRLTSLDSQMQQIFNQQQSNANTTNAISQVADDLNDLPGPSSGSNPTVTVTAAEATKTISDYWAAIDAAGPKGSSNPQLVAALRHDLTTFENQFRGGLTALTSPARRITFASGATFQVPSSAITNLSQNLKTDGS